MWTSALGLRRDGSAAAGAGNAQAGRGTRERKTRASEVELLLAANEFAGDAADGTVAGSLRARLVDLVGSLRGIGKDDDLIVGDLQEAAEDGHDDDLAGTVGRERAVAEAGHERGVAGEHGDLSLAGRHDEPLHILTTEDGALGGYDAQREWHGG